MRGSSAPRAAGPAGPSGPTGPNGAIGPTEGPIGSTEDPTGPTEDPNGPTEDPTGPTEDPTGPTVARVDPLTVRVTGRCWRAIDPAHRASALSGSRAAGRYSRAGSPALYLSSSPEGVAAAMIAHADARSPQLVLVELDVDASGIVDLRDPVALAVAGVDPADAAAPWQEAVAVGAEPPSWRVRDRLVELGAHGLIDPSRKRPGLWHLTLFDWNVPGAPRVELVRGSDTDG